MAGRGVAPRVDPNVWEHPKTRAVAKQLGMRPERVVYHLTQMWGAVLRRKSGGLLFRGSHDIKMQRIMQRHFGQDVRFGQPVTMLQALLDAGFLEQHGADFWVHDWADWQGGTSRAPAPAQTDYPLRDSQYNSGIPEFS